MIRQGRTAVQHKSSPFMCGVRRLEAPESSGFSGNEAELHERHLSTRYRHVCVPAACQAVFRGPWPPFLNCVYSDTSANE